MSQTFIIVIMKNEYVWEISKAKIQNSWAFLTKMDNSWDVETQKDSNIDFALMGT